MRHHRSHFSQASALTTSRNFVFAFWIFLASTAASLVPVSNGQSLYQAGDVVENFTLINRANGEPVSLHDFEGKIVFLEWFAYWCPFCQAAAAEIETGIVGYYSIQGGNPDGIPVMHVGLNLQGNAEAFSQDFIDTYHLGLVLNDFDRAVASRFQPSNQPIFAIINGVSNSPSHEQWELLYTRLGYGDLDHPINEFRQAIDAVEAGPTIEPPVINAAPLDLRIATGTEILLRVDATGSQLEFSWTKDGEPLPEQTASELRIESANLSDAGEYSVVVSYPAGESQPLIADVEVFLSADDYLLQAGLSGADLDWGADPDRDGSLNIFEYLAQTDPQDPASLVNPTVTVEHQVHTTQLTLQFSRSENVAGVSLKAHFGIHPHELSHTHEVLTDFGPVSIEVTFPTDADAYFGKLFVTGQQN